MNIFVKDLVMPQNINEKMNEEIMTLDLQRTEKDEMIQKMKQIDEQAVEVSRRSQSSAHSARESESKSQVSSKRKNAPAYKLTKIIG